MNEILSRIVVDPQVCFGKPCIDQSAISTEASGVQVTSHHRRQAGQADLVHACSFRTDLFPSARRSVKWIGEDGGVWVKMPAGTLNRIQRVGATELGQLSDWLAPFSEDVCDFGS
jgi:hypothetical protein